MLLNKKKIIFIISILIILFILSLSFLITGGVFLGIHEPNLNLNIHNKDFYYVLSGAILVGIGILNIITLLIISFIYLNNKTKMKILFQSKKKE